MNIFSKLHQKWKSMPTGEKIKLVITGVCNIGADLLTGLMLNKVVPEDEKKWKKACMVATAGGIGMWLGNIASKQLNDVVDICYGYANDNEEDDDA